MVYDEYGAAPRVAEVPDPVCGPGDVVVEVHASGVCRSDWHAWRGHDPVPLPQVPGHEWAGVVVETGAAVRRVRVGERVTAPFVCGCGVCALCRAGDAQVCEDQQQPGFTMPGSYAERVLVPAADTNVVALPDEVTTSSAAALGCRIATAHRAVVAHGGLGEGQWLLVLGCGGVGLSAVLVARAVGAHVVAVDVSAAARERALELGADLALDGTDLAAVAARVRDHCGGAHVGLDAVGSAALVRTSLHSLRPRGRHVQVGLLLGDDAAASVPMDLVVARELAVLGSHGMPAVDYPALLDLVATGRLDPAALVGRVVGLEAAGPALAAMDEPAAQAGITVVDPRV
ncbi:alcohol dehydrogenase [Marmoricola endophyticus]|uniref:Alcohol dehydrogenase n=1 Tax=Marmoricola endophyticus TaxID=2040280 RepID=A0A917BLZ5_9ACTN|nr:alcohol dehydrogenase [Marmoricola endophyticus]